MRYNVEFVYTNKTYPVGNTTPEFAIVDLPNVHITQAELNTDWRKNAELQNAIRALYPNWSIWKVTVINGGNNAPLNPPGVNMPIYRLLLVHSTSRIDSGATYATCNRANPNGCQPVQFTNLQAAYDYCREHNEVPVMLDASAYNENDVWDMVEGRKAIPTGPDTTTVLGILALAWLKFKGFF